MKSLSTLFTAGMVVLATFAASPYAQAASAASDVSSNYSSATWITGSNLGTGFGAWNLFGAGTNSGKYVGGTGLSDGSFGLYAADTNSSYDAQRPFSGALTASQTFSADFGHTTINSGGSVGINFQSGTGSTATTVFSVVANGTDLLLNDGGSGGNFRVAADAAGTDFKFTFTYNGGNSYSFTLNSASGTNYTAQNDLSNITQVQFFDFQQGGNQNFGFDNLSVVPEPGTWLAGAALACVVAWKGRRYFLAAV